MRDRWLGIVGHLQDWISYSMLIAVEDQQSCLILQCSPCSK